MPELLAAIAERLRGAGVPFAVIGAAAMSARGFPRQTLDVDLFTTARGVLGEAFWQGLPRRGDVRHGDADDPLAGAVRFTDPEIDVVVGRARWQADAVARAEPLHIGELILPVVTLPDLILLKLDAGGYRDAADVRMMLSGAGAGLAETIEVALPVLPAEAQQLWREIRMAER